jgi:hypothetical protein
MLVAVGQMADPIAHNRREEPLALIHTTTAEPKEGAA